MNSRLKAIPISAHVLSIILILFISCGGGGNHDAPVSTAPEPHIAEQSDYYDGVMWHRYFRYDNNKIGYATSIDGLKFDRYPDMIFNGVFPVLVEDGEDVYLLVRQSDEYNLYDIEVKKKPAFIKTILKGDYFNVGVAVKDGRWHMLAEGKTGDSFHLRYSWADWPDLDFEANMGPVLIPTSGNPCLRYIPERNAILALYGDHTGGYWKIKAATFDMTSWTVRGFTLASAGIHLSDPDLGVGVEPSPLILTIGSNQNAVSTYLFSGSKLELYDAIIAGSVEMEDLGVTMSY